MQAFEITLPSPLFPFTLDDLPGFDYKQYRLSNVFRSIDAEERQACVELWLRNGVIGSPRAGWQRSGEVCYLMYETASGRLVGVNTLYPGRISPRYPECFVNRMYISPGHRGGRLMITATAATLCYASTALNEEGQPGVVNINENSKLARPGMRRIFTRLGYRWQGRHRGRDVWYFDFAASRIRQLNGGI